MKKHPRTPPRHRKRFGHKQELNVKFFRLRNKDKRKTNENLRLLRRGQGR